MRSGNSPICSGSDPSNLTPSARRKSVTTTSTSNPLPCHSANAFALSTSTKKVPISLHHLTVESYATLIVHLNHTSEVEPEIEAHPCFACFHRTHQRSGQPPASTGCGKTTDIP